jgi:hypothetical protein
MGKENNTKKTTAIKSLLVVLLIPFVLVFIIIGELLTMGLAENHNKIISSIGSNGSIEWLLCTIFFSLLTIRIIYYWAKIEAKPDPWDGLVSESEISKTHIICRHCLSIEKLNDYYCSSCKRNIGNYNNVMPFLWIGVMGEFLLDGVQDKRKKTIFNKVMFCLLAISQYFILAPWYLYRVFSKPSDSDK